MGYKGRIATLTVEQAQQLLADGVPGIEVVGIKQAAFTNDVFRTLTRSHDNYYIKFHTARWYLDMPDTAPVVERELAGHQLLAKRGMALPYRMWSDCSRSIVPWSVLITQELVGEPVSEILKRQPEVMDPLVEALGAYLRRLQTIRFTHRAALCGQIVDQAPSTGVIDVPQEVRFTCSGDEDDRPAIRRGEDRLAQACEAGVVDDRIASELERACEPATNALITGQPCFTLLNCHLGHFHARPADGGWEITGMYDFESVSADHSSNDIMELEIDLTPIVGSSAWRRAFRRGYGELADFPRYKVRILRDLLYYMTSSVREGRFGNKVPDPGWLKGRLVQVANAQCWDELEWFPARQV